MSHLMESTRRMAENDPNIRKIKRVPVGKEVPQYEPPHGVDTPDGGERS
jgi:hypothetical protein